MSPGTPVTIYLRSHYNQRGEIVHAETDGNYTVRTCGGEQLTIHDSDLEAIQTTERGDPLKPQPTES